MDAILKELAQRAAPIILAVIIDSLPDIREFFEEKAKESDNVLDDHAVKIIFDFLEDWLPDLK